uniref:snaclec 3-like isoform X1 n=1 Tax=Podarcis muralis TaxID=64176 RepID=UPI00109FA7EA|nr:snaclec 3-like isoform X1 [Podarcis muralis]
MGTWTALCAFLLIAFIHGTCSQTCLCARGFCERGWVQYQNACYKAVTQPMTWTDAEMACQRYDRDSHLASIHSPEENDFIFHLMGKPLDYTKGKAYWIGAHDTFKEGDFVWTDGSKFDYRTFPPSQPDGLAGEHYLGSWVLQNGEKQTPLPCKALFWEGSGICLGMCVSLCVCSYTGNKGNKIGSRPWGVKESTEAEQTKHERRIFC